jgi:putative molybdopterin biosynthesis protein
MADSRAPADLAGTLARAARQQQFLEVIDVEEAQARLRANLDWRPKGAEFVPLTEALQRVLAKDVVAAVDVPGFDRASVDGFALRAADTARASDAAPCRLRLNPELVTPGLVPALPVAVGTATVIATGGMLPRGADAVAMIEQTEPSQSSFDGSQWIELRRPVPPGTAIAAAGGDIGRGEVVMRARTVVTSREIGMLAAWAWRRWPSTAARAWRR